MKFFIPNVVEIISGEDKGKTGQIHQIKIDNSINKECYFVHLYDGKTVVAYEEDLKLFEPPKPFKENDMKEYYDDSMRMDDLEQEMDSSKNYEMVDHPQHYRPGVYEAINVIEAWDLNFNLGSAVKYISRCGLKPDSSLDTKMKAAEDLRKAAWYCKREADRIIQKETVKNS